MNVQGLNKSHDYQVEKKRQVGKRKRDKDIGDHCRTPKLEVSQKGEH